MRNGSSIGEKMDDVIVSNRQKHNGMSWSKSGSVAFATVTALKRKNEFDKCPGKEAQFSTGGVISKVIATAQVEIIYVTFYKNQPPDRKRFATFGGDGDSPITAELET